MKNHENKKIYNPGRNGISRREFFELIKGGALFSLFPSFSLAEKAKLDTRIKAKGVSAVLNDIFQVRNIPDQPFYTSTYAPGNNHHIGVDTLLDLMGEKGLKFYRSPGETALSSPSGLIAPEDVVLIKVNAQWKYRGCTNSDLIRGLIQRILDHPDGFTGEVVIFENGQGRGSLNCDTSSYYGNSEIHANAIDESHSFLYLVNTLFNDPRLSSFLLDPVRSTFIGNSDHVTDGYRLYENVSYPCFTTEGGRRVELKEGVWNGSGYSQNLKLINVPVLKHHDTGGSEITAALKHMYGVVSMEDGQSGYRHYFGLGETCGKMMASVETPVLNIMDAIWVSHDSLGGYPPSTTYRANQILASQDPVALDYWAAKYVLYPVDNNTRHHPSYTGIDVWLRDARDAINNRGGLRNLDKGIVVNHVTKNEEEMQVYTREAEVIETFNPVNPPLNFTGEKVLNRSLFFSEYINILTWEANPENENIVEYRLYELKDGKQSLLATVDASTFSYHHRNVLKNKTYNYALGAVNNEGVEGLPAYLIL
ncbi:MAG: DUF362 domain-containing protein [Candidatus Aminicenantaceae bacterium]